MNDASLESLRPNYLNYLEYRSYLKDFILYLQGQNSKYSFRWIAKKAEMSSPQLISMILNGQRSLTESVGTLLAHALNLTTDEESYLKLLIRIEQAKSFEQQSELIQELKIKFKDGDFKALAENELSYIKNWYLPVLREMVRLKDFVPDTAMIANQLGISEVEAFEAWETLLSLEKVKPSSDGKSFFRNEPSLKVSDFVAPMLMAQFHFQMLEKSFQAIKLPRPERHFETLTFSFNETQIDEIKKLIQQVFRKIDIVSEESSNPNVVYQVNAQLFKITKSGEIHE